MTRIRITTIQAPNQDVVIREICSYLIQSLGLEAEFVIDAPWKERQRMLDKGDVQIAWICGLPYVRRSESGVPALELLVAPIMLGDRYHDLPIYFSDVVVRRDSSYQAFADLRGARWAYNEPNSHSGHNITLATLAALGARRGFFSSAIEAGSHARSIELVRQGSVDAAAIDSTVLDLAREADDGIASSLRVLASLGPSPIPPLVILKSVEHGLRQDIRTALSQMHHTEYGRRGLGKGKIKRLQIVEDESYDPIRRMARQAEGVRW